MSVMYGTTMAEVKRMLEVWDSLPKSTKKEILRFLRDPASASSVNLSPRAAFKNKTENPVGTINLFVQ